MSETTTENNKNTPPGTRETLGKAGLNLNKLIPFVAVVVLFVVFSITARNFFSMRSIISLAL